MEVLTQAFALLGTGQTSLAKYVFIAAREDEPPNPQDVVAFLGHVLERADPTRDWHFLANTAVDTLDYSGSGLNQGSKVVVAAVGPRARVLGKTVGGDLALPDGFDDARVAIPGVLCVRGAPDAPIERLCASQRADGPLAPFPLVVVVDDAAFASRSPSNLLWVTFTRSDPARDVRGVEETFADKAWGCRGSVVIDARLKAHHAPPLEEDPEIERRVDRLFVRGGPLARWG
jgi:4-hydroxy-3-polyprenylbenzoate decarboxylase